MVSSNRLGYWSAVAMILIGIAYIVALAAGFAVHGLDEPIADPVLAVMELLTLLSAVPLVVLMAAVLARAAPGRKTHAVVALAFMTIFAGLTASVHFTALTAGRQAGSSGIVWPSSAYAVELLAWDLFLGLSLVFAAPVFNGSGERLARRGLYASGVLCLAGLVGPATGSMRLQLIGVAGYALLLPLACVALAGIFRRLEAPPLVAEGR